MCLGRHAESLDGSGTLVAATTQPLTDNVLGIDEDDVGLMMWSVIGNHSPLSLTLTLTLTLSIG